MSSGSNFWKNFLNWSSVTIGNFDEKEANDCVRWLSNTESLHTAQAVNHRIKESALFLPSCFVRWSVSLTNAIASRRTVNHLLEYCHVLTDKQVRRLNAKIATLEAEYEDLQYQEARNPPAQHRTSEDDQRPYVRNATDPLEPRAPTPPPKDDKYTGSQPSSPESPRSTRKMPWFKKKSQTYSLAKGAAGEGGYRRAKRYFGEEYV
ncbi:Peptidase C14, caspase catalytic subunit p20 [Rhodotorula toruloides ATCC 204091]|uniref:Peptidase C14, caspase catalytic subunit p20 n=1 Tax=Rhodotorula toruloides TaxID=5286 RepID=A0A0K3CQW7_RHOTO|nr:Peptidase C14, caspase catalytic subunit p20 [Rhodotorula toruloides ATCC 204091]KAK4330542.1 Peptidase C14, caspase catalytic subunit p20 [Rhodotorula toruloides]PRQ70892.1 peptidase C14, caspase catalytic subunit p20 [Rhodotorula toruloides]